MSAPERDAGERDIEVAAKPARRRFTLEYKRKIVREADGCKTPGAIGALFRREGAVLLAPDDVARGPLRRQRPGAGTRPMTRVAETSGRLAWLKS